MCRRIVVQNPFSCSPQLEVFPADSISKAAKNVPVHCLVHSVALWNELMINNALAVKEDFQHHLALWSVSIERVLLWRSQELPVWWLLPSLWVIKVTTLFIACDYSVRHLQFRVRHADNITSDNGCFMQLVFSLIFGTVWTHVVYGVFCGRFHVTHLTFQQQRQPLCDDLRTWCSWREWWCCHFVQ